MMRATSSFNPTSAQPKGAAVELAISAIIARHMERLMDPPTELQVDFQIGRKQSPDERKRGRR